MNLGLPDLTPWQKDTARIADALERIADSLEAVEAAAEVRRRLDLAEEQGR